MKEFFKRLWTPDGRRNRRDYLLGWLFIFVCMAVIGGVIELFKEVLPQIQILSLLVLPLILPPWFISIQRLHDCDKTGYWLLLKFVPLANLCLYLYLWFMPGTSYVNKYDYTKDGGMTKE